MRSWPAAGPQGCETCLRLGYVLPCPGGLRISQKGYRDPTHNRLRLSREQEHAHPVQRLFSIFPHGLPGIGLLFLRSSVAIGLLFDDHFQQQALAGWAQGVAILLSVALFAGYLTPVAAAIGLLSHGLVWFELGGGRAAVEAIICLDIIALALLGPGGYSVDAFRFGRRMVVLPPD